MDFEAFYNTWKNTMDLESLEQLYNEQLDDDLIIKSNQKKLSKGEMPNGGLIKGEYSPVTLVIKRKTGGYISPTGLIALKNKGDFYKSFFVAKIKNESILDAMDAKTTMLMDEYGDEILDIPDHAKEAIIEEAKDRFYEQLNNKLNA